MKGVPCAKLDQMLQKKCRKIDCCRAGVFVLIWAAAVCGSVNAQNGNLPTTTAGAVADSQSIQYNIDGNAVSVFSGPRNSLYAERRVTWWKERYYYFTHLQVLRGPSGRHFRLLRLGSKTLLSFKIDQVPIDVATLLQKIRGTKNADARSENLEALRPYRLVISLPDGLSEIQAVPLGAMRSLNEPIAVLLVIPGQYAKDLGEALERGEILPEVAVDVLRKATSLSSTELDWRKVSESSYFRKYSGPAGPQFVTAFQAGEVAGSIMDEMDLVEWNESGQNVRNERVQWLADHLHVAAPQFMSVQQWLQGMRVNVQELSGLTDVINKMAREAKNSSDQQWCRKFESLESGSNRSGSGQHLNINFVKGLTHFIGNWGSKRRQQSAMRNLLRRQDCGRSAIANQFKYGFSGRVYIPKSIRVFENLHGRLQRSFTASWNSWQISQFVNSFQAYVTLQ